MTTNKRVLLIGLDPTLLDFTTPELATMNLTAEKVLAGLKAESESLRTLGYDPVPCLVDLGATAESVVRARLSDGTYGAVCIGAGLRLNPVYFLVFERLVNVIHECAPSARICFNTKPTDTVDAIKRWI